MKIKALLTSLITILFLTGCQINKNQPDVKPHVNKTVKEVEFWTLQLGLFSDYINPIISEFEQNHPDIKIKWIDVPFSEGEKRALASIISKNTPDLINLNPDFASTLATRSAILYLDDILTPEEKSRYIKESLEANSINKKLFGFPWYITTPITFYNTAILEKSYLPKDFKLNNFYELNKIAPLIKNKTQKYAIFPPLSEKGKMLKLLNQNNAIDIKDSKIIFNTQASEGVLNFWKNLYQNDLIPKEALTQGHRESLEKFMSEETAILVTGGNFAKIIKENSPNVYKNLNVGYQVTGNSGKYTFSIMNLIIPKKAKYPKEAKEFALFLTNAQNQLEFCKLAPVMPSTIAALEDEFFLATQDDIYSRIRQINAKQLKNAQTPVPLVQNKSELNQIIDNLVQSILLNKGETSILLKNAQNEWDKLD